MHYGIASEPTCMGGCKIPKFSGGDPPKCFCSFRRRSYKRSVPILCPSIDGVLATPLVRKSVALPLIRLYSALVDRSCLLAKWLREGVRVRARAGVRECTTFFLFLQHVVNILVFVGLVASGCS